MSPHVTQLRVRFYELDPYSHVNHSVYIQYFETARVEMLADVGFGLDRLQAEDTALVVTNISTRFLRPAGLSDDLHIETGLVEVGRVRSRWAQRIVKLDAGTSPTTICTQVIDFASTNIAGSPRRLPAGLADAMAPYTVAPDWLGKDQPK